MSYPRPRALECPFCPYGVARHQEGSSDDEPAWRCDKCNVRLVVTNPAEIPYTKRALANFARARKEKAAIGKENA